MTFQGIFALPSIASFPVCSAPFTAMALAVVLAGCAGNNEIDVESGVGITATRSICPASGIPVHTGDITVFNPLTSRDAAAIDVTATITNLRTQCNDQGEQIFALASFDVQASRRNPAGARQVTLPYFSTVVQGGSSVVAKRLGSVTINFADGQYRAQAPAQASAYVSRAAVTLPAEIAQQITRRRKSGDADAAVDPMTIPEVRAAVQRATFELLVGFQLSQDQLRYNVTR